MSATYALSKMSSTYVDNTDALAGEGLSSCDRELKREAAVIRPCPSFITKLLVAKFIVTYWGIKLTMAYCRVVVAYGA